MTFSLLMSIITSFDLKYSQEKSGPASSLEQRRPSKQESFFIWLGAGTSKGHFLHVGLERLKPTSTHSRQGSNVRTKE